MSNSRGDEQAALCPLLLPGGWLEDSQEDGRADLGQEVDFFSPLCVVLYKRGPELAQDG